MLRPSPHHGTLWLHNDDDDDDDGGKCEKLMIETAWAGHLFQD